MLRYHQRCGAQAQPAGPRNAVLARLSDAHISLSVGVQLGFGDSWSFTDYSQGAESSLLGWGWTWGATFPASGGDGDPPIIGAGIGISGQGLGNSAWGLQIGSPSASLAYGWTGGRGRCQN